LERRKQLLERARFLINERWPLLEDWAAGHSRVLHWTPPAEMAAPRRLGRGPFARVALDATGGGRDLFLQLPVPDRLDGPRRSAHSRVQHDDRAGRPIP